MPSDGERTLDEASGLPGRPLELAGERASLLRRIPGDPSAQHRARHERVDKHLETCTNRGAVTAPLCIQRLLLQISPRNLEKVQNKQLCHGLLLMETDWDPFA